MSERRDVHRLTAGALAEDLDVLDGWRYRGWFAAIDADASSGFPWQPVLQMRGACASINIWFATQSDCLAFIRSQVIGAPMMDEREPHP